MDSHAIKAVMKEPPNPRIDTDVKTAALRLLFGAGHSQHVSPTTMRREDGRGRCEHCGVTFPYEMVHNGFNDSTHAYCDRCGTTAIIGLWAAEKRPPRIPDRLTPLPPEIEILLAPCTCGGRFRGSAPARCPSCREALSPELAADWLEAQAPGARTGWRWQRSWAGLYALILGGRVVFDPWKVEPTG